MRKEDKFYMHKGQVLHGNYFEVLGDIVDRLEFDYEVHSQPPCVLDKKNICEITIDCAAESGNYSDEEIRFINLNYNNILKELISRVSL